MIYFVYFIGALIAAISVLIYLRKLQYDRTHINLLNLADEIGGRVLRKSFANQPVYQGEYKNRVVQISFSSDHLDSKRQDYITYSINYQFNSSVTISDTHWLNKMGEKAEETDTAIVFGDRFLIRSKDKKILDLFEKNAEILQDLFELNGLAYLMFSPDGMLSEQLSAEYIVDTKVDKIVNRLELFDRIYRHLN
jgi:hypothetical protein